MGTLVAAGGFAAVMTGIGLWIRRREAEGDYDVDRSSAYHPGLRRLFDFGPNGWSRDGVNQRQDR